MLQMARYTVCSKRKPFNRLRSISLLSLSLRGCLVDDTNTITDSFYGTELGVPLLLLLVSRSHRLAPYLFSTFLAGTHYYLAGIHKSFFTFWTRKTTVHRGLPQEDGIALSPSSLWGLPTQQVRSSWQRAPPGFSFGRPGHPRADCAGISQVVAALLDLLIFLFVWMNMPWVFLTLPACSLI